MKPSLWYLYGNIDFSFLQEKDEETDCARCKDPGSVRQYQRSILSGGTMTKKLFAQAMAKVFPGVLGVGLLNEDKEACS